MLENTLSSSEKSAMILSLIYFSTSLPYGKSGEIKILQVSATKPDQSCMFWQHILYKCPRVQNLVKLKFPQTYKLLETYRLNFDSKLAIQLGVLSKYIELPFQGENICALSSINHKECLEAEQRLFISLKETDLSQPALVAWHQASKPNLLF